MEKLEQPVLEFSKRPNLDHSKSLFFVETKNGGKSKNEERRKGREKEVENRRIKRGCVWKERERERSKGMDDGTGGRRFIFMRENSVASVEQALVEVERALRPCRHRVAAVFIQPRPS